MVNAIPHKTRKRTEFRPCSYYNSSPDSLNVTLSPDPLVPGSPATLTIFGTSTRIIPPGSELSTRLREYNNNRIIYDVSFCAIPGIACPMPAGTTFKITKELIYSPTTYTIAVGIVDRDNLMACADTTIGVMPRDVTPDAVPAFFTFKD
ncbi:7455_t:CDS:1 [Paraglomus brasilianum]|uniref:Phosphatidylglycerol/phosphatidylinositol transfer protein n=1 Tax=Paraglomus brasilianum TaxID=144538 RepID=A0A9N8ZRQ4_9GLOM|nr:7455_t:CDS:1 [Paraglomus brasilianum]